jgi:phage shock protein PspC (stress-responsive transcriptional regulator)
MNAEKIPRRVKGVNAMEDQHTNLIARDDTFLGVCQGMAEDFGFNPLYLRVALSVALLWNPEIVLGVYAALALIVLFSRLVFPNPRIKPAATSAEPVAAVAAPAPDPAPARAQPPADLDKVGRQLLPLAA